MGYDPTRSDLRDGSGAFNISRVEAGHLNLTGRVGVRWVIRPDPTRSARFDPTRVTAVVYVTMAVGLPASSVGKPQQNVIDGEALDYCT